MEKGKNIKNTYPVSGMSCASCAARVDKTLNGLPGVYQATVNYATAVAQVEYNPEVCSDATLQAAVQDAGYDLLVDIGEDAADKAEEIRLTRYRKIKGVQWQPCCYLSQLWLSVCFLKIYPL